jgi:hypothetical protein
MSGTILNIITVILGGTIGLVFGGRLPGRIRETVVAGLGLFTAAYGLKIFLDTQNPITILSSLLIGGILGEWWRIEDGLQILGSWIEARYNAARPTQDGASFEQKNRFVRGFLTASLVFCVGPMTILGSIQDGLSGDYSILAVKSVLDGFAALAFASTLGEGVLFSIFTILIYQGGLSLLANQASAWITESMMVEMTAVGGVMLVGLAASSLLEVKKIRVGSFLPALIIAPLIVKILGFF